MDLDREAFKQKVVEAVTADLGHHPWFSGVCLDDINQYYPDDLEGAIEHAYCETLMWDAPNLGFEL